MQQRTLGQVKTPVSALGYGAMSFSDFYGPTDDDKSNAILDRCRDLGITHIDTSNVYGMGMSEKRIGAYLAKQGKQAQDFFTIATKAAIASKPDGTRYFDNSLQHLEAQLDKSLQRLGVEQVELFYVHRRDAKVPIEEVAESLATLVKRQNQADWFFGNRANLVGDRPSGASGRRSAVGVFPLATRAPELGLVQKCAELDTTFAGIQSGWTLLLTDHPLSFEVCQQLMFMQVNPRFQAIPIHATWLKQMALGNWLPTWALQRLAWLLPGCWLRGITLCRYPHAFGGASERVGGWGQSCR